MLITDYTDKELELLNLVECGAPLWLPNPDNAPQVQAYLSDAKIVGYGGAAGGGKTDLMIGKALNQHLTSMIVRQEGTEMTAIEDRLFQVLGTMNGYNGQKRIFRLPKRQQQIEFGSLPHLGAERSYTGRPHDFLGFDEATYMLLSQIRFLATWLRSVIKGQRCEMLLTFNPPIDAAGRWVIDYFAPWLGQNANAEPGEIRHFITVAQQDIEVPDRPCVLVNNEPVFDFNAEDYEEVDILIPQSRTFIPARVTDNTYLGRAYMAELQGLPEPLRSQMLHGDFTAGMEDDEWQVIPTAWVKAAMDRWEPLSPKPVMDSMGVDVARGGRDNSIIFRRHGMWFDEPLVYPGTETPDGHLLMALIVAAMRDEAPVHVDEVGVGSSPVDFLNIARFQVVGMNGGAATKEQSAEGRLGFTNVKSLLWWRMREALDPGRDTGAALPPDEQLLKDLTALTWKPEGARIRVESRKEIIKRIGRSPDWGSACVLALMDTPKRNEFFKRGARDVAKSHDPYEIFGG